jgi:hypothetical protein
MTLLEKLNVQEWEAPIPEDIQKKALQSLENGMVLYFPSLPFQLNQPELRFVKPEMIHPNSKNISYDGTIDTLSGTVATGSEAEELKNMIKRYSKTTEKFLKNLIPHYAENLIVARTSFRPVEIYGRETGDYRSNDTLLHVDAFPSTPTKGFRILRVFTNINPHGKPRVWQVGEPLESVFRKFLNRIAPPQWGSSLYLKLTGKTKDYRTPYDHYMLQIHDTMKGDTQYQTTLAKEDVSFPPGSSWIVYTDQVSHAALSGEDVLEQTFYLSPSSMKNESTVPLKVMEKILNKSLV